MHTPNHQIIGKKTNFTLSTQWYNVTQHPPANIASSHLECMLIWLYEPRPFEQLHRSQGRLAQRWLWAIGHEDYAQLTVQDLQPEYSAEAYTISGVHVIEANTPLASGSKIQLQDS